VAIVFGASLIGFSPGRDVFDLSLPGGHSYQIRNAILIASRRHGLDVRGALGGLLVLTGVVALWRTTLWRGAIGAAPIVAGTILINGEGVVRDPVFLTLPRAHGIHVTDVVGMTIVLAGVVVYWCAPPALGSRHRH